MAIVHSRPSGQQRHHTRNVVRQRMLENLI